MEARPVLPMPLFFYPARDPDFRQGVLDGCKLFPKDEWQSADDLLQTLSELLSELTLDGLRPDSQVYNLGRAVGLCVALASAANTDSR